ncbi:hypothetical protein [Holdemanella biformis]|nr:hypothetical protein [Holdemanella biformis]
MCFNLSSCSSKDNSLTGGLPLFVLLVSLKPSVLAACFFRRLMLAYK